MKDTPERERIVIREALLTYCRMDTEALVGVLEALRGLT